MREELAKYIVNLLYQIASIESQLILLVVLIVISIIVLDAVSLFASKQQEASGISTSSTTVSIEGSKTLPVRNYVSEIQGLAGKPDALVRKYAPQVRLYAQSWERITGEQVKEMGLYFSRANRFTPVVF